MTIRFESLSRVNLTTDTLPFSQIARNERAIRQDLFEMMQPLRDHDVFNKTFDDCCIYSRRYTPISASPEYQKEVYNFELCRAQYLENVIAYARGKFQGKADAEQKFFELSQKQLRAIDPHLIGESRYGEQDWFYIKIYKTVSHFFWGQLYMWCNRDYIRMWAARHDILKWGAVQDPSTALRVPLDFYAPMSSDTGFVPRTTRDKVIQDIFLKEVGFEQEDIKSLQGILKLLPGRIQKFGYHPSTRAAHIILEKEWIARPNWELIDKEMEKQGEEIPKILAPISMLIEELQKSGTPIPDALKVIGNRLAIVPKEVYVKIAETLDAEIVKESDETRLALKPGTFRLVIPARFGLLSPDIYIDVLAVSRKKDGTLTLKIGAGASTGFDTTIKGLVLALTKLFLKEGSTAVTLPPKGEGPIRLPDDDKLNEIHKASEMFVKWNT